MSAQIQSITAVRKLYPKVIFLHQFLPIFFRFTLQKSASFLAMVGSSFVGNYFDRQIIARIASPAPKYLPFFSGLNFPDVSVFPASPSRQSLVISSLSASLTAPAYDDNRCTHGD